MIEIPILCNTKNKKYKNARNLLIGVWVNVGSVDFDNVLSVWKEEKIIIVKGILNNDLPLYGKSSGLSVSLTTQAGGLRPKISFTSSSPLASDQQNGITLQRFASFLDDTSIGFN